MKRARLVFAGLLTIAAAAATPAAAEVSVSIGIGIPVPPPPPVVEVLPVPVAGYVWVPGYWAWHHDRHIWVRGRHVLARPGHYWVSDRWEPRGRNWHFVPGGWARDEHWRKPGRDHAYGHWRGRD